MISLSIIEKPLFGPAFSHQHFMENGDSSVKLWKSYYFGDNTPSHNVSYYMNCVLKLYNEWMNDTEENTNIPLVINTHGWLFGLGATIMKKLIGNIKPTHLIEIEWESSTRDSKDLFKSDEFDNIGQIKDIFVSNNSNTSTSSSSNIKSNPCTRSFDWKKKPLKNKQNNNQREENSALTQQEASSLVYWWKKLINKENKNKNNSSGTLSSSSSMFASNSDDDDDDDDDGVVFLSKNNLTSKQKYWAQYLSDIANVVCEKSDEKESENGFGDWYNYSRIKNNFKNSDDFELFYAFFNSNVHYVTSIQYEYNRIDSQKKELKKFGNESNQPNQSHKQQKQHQHQTQAKPRKLMKMRGQRRMTSAHKRVLNTISYFTKKIFLDYDPGLYLSQMSCYQIKIDCIAFSFINGFNFDKSMIFDALNGTIVALCCANLDFNTMENNDYDKDDEIVVERCKKRRRLNSGKGNNNNNNNNGSNNGSNKGSEGDVIEVNIIESTNCFSGVTENIKDCIDCVGLGIIRGVNIKEKILYLLTPVDAKFLNKVDLFVRGTTTLPSVLLNDSSLLNPALYLNGVPPSNKVQKERILTAMS